MHVRPCALIVWRCAVTSPQHQAASRNGELAAATTAKDYAERRLADVAAELSSARDTITTYDEVQQVCSRCDPKKCA